MTDTTLNSDSLLLTNEEGYVVAVPNTESTLTYQEQGITECCTAAFPAEGDLTTYGNSYFLTPLLENATEPKCISLLKKIRVALKRLPQNIELPVLLAIRKIV